MSNGATAVFEKVFQPESFDSLTAGAGGAAGM